MIGSIPPRALPGHQQDRRGRHGACLPGSGYGGQGLCGREGAAEQYLADEAVVERFEREAQALATFSHPNIVNILGVGNQQGKPYIIMEYVDGGDSRSASSARAA